MEKGLDLRDATRKFLNAPVDKRQNVFEFVAHKTGVSPQSIEKDWWVTLFLRIIYSMPYASNIQFKGGTSLSKCWHVINRFSEDIDLAINRDFLGFSGDLSKNQISDKLRRASKSFIKVSISNNDNNIPTQDPLQIYVDYPSAYRGEHYIVPRVVLEISGRSNNIALKQGNINSIIETYLGEKFALTLPPLPLTVVSPERTLIEKICLLHEEFNKDKGEIRFHRMSRHLYDIHMLCHKGYANLILNNENLFSAIIHHRFMYNRIDGVDYNTETPGGFNILPPTHIFEKYVRDYREMETTMIYGNNIPSFGEIITTIRQLNMALNSMEWKQKYEFNPGHVETPEEKRTSLLKKNNKAITSLYESFTSQNIEPKPKRKGGLKL